MSDINLNTLLASLGVSGGTIGGLILLYKFCSKKGKSSCVANIGGEKISINVAPDSNSQASVVFPTKPVPQQPTATAERQPESKSDAV